MPHYTIMLASKVGKYMNCTVLLLESIVSIAYCLQYLHQNQDQARLLLLRVKSHDFPAVFWREKQALCTSQVAQRQYRYWPDTSTNFCMHSFFDVRIKFSRGSIENISSISSKRVWKNQVNLHKFKMAALSTKILNNSKFVALVMQL